MNPKACVILPCFYCSDGVQCLEYDTVRMAVVNYLALYNILNFGWLLIPLINIYSHTYFWGRQS